MIQTNGVSILNHYILVYKLNLIEHFSIECGKTKTKLTTTANEQKEKYRLKRGKARESAGKRGKARVTKSWLMLVLHLIGWGSGASFEDQSQSKVKQNQCNPGLLLTLLKMSLPRAIRLGFDYDIANTH